MSNHDVDCPNCGGNMRGLSAECDGRQCLKTLSTQVSTQVSTQDNRGAYSKFIVNRVDGRDLKGGDRHNAELFVLDLTYDPYARMALAAYVVACKDEYPLLAKDLKSKADLYGLLNLLLSKAAKNI